MALARATARIAPARAGVWWARGVRQPQPAAMQPAGGTVPPAPPSSKGGPREPRLRENRASRRAGCSSGSITLTHPVRNRYPWAQAAALALDDAAAGSPRRRRAGVDASTVEPPRSARARRARPVLGPPPSREPSVAGGGASAPVTPPPAATTAPRGNAAGLRPVWCAAPGCCARLGRHLDASANAS